MLPPTATGSGVSVTDTPTSPGTPTKVEVLATLLPVAASSLTPDTVAPPVISVPGATVASTFTFTVKLSEVFRWSGFVHDSEVFDPTAGELQVQEPVDLVSDTKVVPAGMGSTSRASLTTPP